MATTTELLQRYDRPGPRYTSYPTAVSFHEGFTEADYRDRLARADRLGEEPLSLYAHLPFCQERCLYCGCNVIISPRRSVAQPYLDRLIAEIDLLARHLPHRRTLSQMHWGGGTPTYYAPEDLVRLFGAITERFRFAPGGEIGIEVDPRVTSFEHIDALATLGVNRLSMGVQDFAPEVQEAVHRIQSYESTKALVDRARERGMRSVNLDLIYGLPYQTRAGYARTLEQVLTIRPERVAVYSFAFVPWIKGHMRHLPPESLPDAGLKLDLLALAIEAFTGAGYRAIGMDHFALPEDELAQAADAGTLSRNFMGYTVQSARDMVAVGISAIGDVQGAFVQNLKKLTTYTSAIDQGRFPVERGYALTPDDELRRHVITEIMCNARLDTAAVERRFARSFAGTFAPELEELTAAGGLVEDGLVTLSPGWIRLTPLGRRFVRNVAMVFDRHLRESAAGPTPVFSRTV
ncbi:MAG: oxygen-independent coproporphyrinogen III oxidase [Candidatus Eisenbacteria bacterium]